MNPIRLLWPVLLFALLLSGQAAAQVASQTPPSGGGRDLGSLDLESLLNTKVITASKFSENLADAPGVISLISQDELREIRRKHTPESPGTGARSEPDQRLFHGPQPGGGARGSD